MTASFPAVEIVWVDSTRDENNWTAVSEAREWFEATDLRCKSCGYLIAERDDAYLIAHSTHFTDDDDLSLLGALAIPKCAVLDVIPLDERDEARF